jgi:heme exporter protein C
MKTTVNPLRKILVPLQIVVTCSLMFVAIWMVFVYAPDEKIMGPVQRIFYFHVPSAIVTFASVFVLLGASVGYLWTRRRALDCVARAATEISLLFCSIVLVTGPIWAKPAWGVWWTWEARLTTTLVLWLILAASLMVRGYARDPELAARLGAVLGILAALDVPVIYKAVDWWRGQHPVVFEPGKKAPLAPEMMHTFLVCMLAFFMLYGLFLMLRVRLALLEERARNLTERSTDR